MCNMPESETTSAKLKSDKERQVIRDGEALRRPCGHRRPMDIARTSLVGRWNIQRNKSIGRPWDPLSAEN